jgi:hypothetical protein
LKGVHEDEMLSFLLNNFLPVCDFCFLFPGLLKRFLALFIEVWGQSEELPVKLRAFICIRRIGQLYEKAKSFNK